MKIEALPVYTGKRAVHIYRIRPNSMKRGLAFFIVVLLSTQASVVGPVSADLSLLTDGGQTDSLDRPLVLWTSLNDGRILTVDHFGNVSVNAFSNGVLSTQWTVFLNVDANNARLDDAQELVSVAHDGGAYVVQMSTQTIFRNFTSSDPVDDAVLDQEGDLWMVYFAGKRRAEQYDAGGFTGVSSTTVSSGKRQIGVFSFPCGGFWFASSGAMSGAASTRSCNPCIVSRTASGSGPSRWSARAPTRPRSSR